MPRWLRQFTFNKIQEHYKQEAENYEKSSKGSNKQTLVNPDGTLNRENWSDVPKPIVPGPNKVISKSSPKISYK